METEGKGSQLLEKKGSWNLLGATEGGGSLKPRGIEKVE